MPCKYGSIISFALSTVLILLYISYWHGLSAFAVLLGKVNARDLRTWAADSTIAHAIFIYIKVETNNCLFGAIADLLLTPKQMEHGKV